MAPIDTAKLYLRQALAALEQGETRAGLRAASLAFATLAALQPAREIGAHDVLGRA